MNEHEEINGHVKELEETIKLLGDHAYTERWAVNEFLTNLDIEFNQDELCKSQEEPIDIKFRNANFQIKAIYDDNRTMLKEYKDDLEKAKNAKTFSEAVRFRKYAPTEISIQEIADLIEKKLGKYHLSPEQYSKIDMLFYFNRGFHGIKENCDFAG